jgi:predicted ester cyclase
MITQADAPSNAQSLVRFLYDEVLSHTGAPDLTERLARVLAPGWESIGDYSGARKTREQFGAQLAGFAKIIPDLKWAVEELFVSGDRLIVRGRASGTPVAALFDAPPTGRRFEIMSMDIHTVADGKVVRTHHVEDWAGALRQLAAG